MGEEGVTSQWRNLKKFPKLHRYLPLGRESQIQLCEMALQGNFSCEKNRGCQVFMAHAYNLSYSGGKDQEDRGLRPAQTKIKTLSQKHPTHIKGLVEWVKWKQTCLVSIRP
jgi:hypothetical protein